MSIEVLPPELAAASGPLRVAAAALASIAVSRRPLLDLLASVPTQELREAAGECLRAYELSTWELSEETEWLAQRLTDAAGHYASRGRAVAEAIPVLTPRVDMPPLRDDPKPAAPAPRPAPAPVAPR